MLPNSHQNQIMHEAHLEVGHRSVFTTLRRVQNFCVWPGMRSDIREYIDQCAHCQGNQHNFRPSPPEITGTPIAPFQEVGIDLVGPFLPPHNGNKYIIALVDHHTGWAEAYPIPDKRSITIWEQIYHQYFSRFGFPKVLLTDQGSWVNEH